MINFFKKPLARVLPLVLFGSGVLPCHAQQTEQAAEGQSGKLPAAAATAQVAPRKALPQSLRVLAGKDNWQMQTAVHHYEDAKGRKLALAGAVHVGNKDYYEQLNKLFAGYQCVLFEMVGGEHLAEDQRMMKNGQLPPLRQEQLEFARKNMLTTAVLYYAMQSLCQRYDFVHQNEHIDYSADNMLHADVSFKELTQMQQQQNSNSLEELLTMSLSAKPQNHLLTLLAEFMGDEDASLRMSMLSAIEQTEQTDDVSSGVVLYGRNLKCFSVLDQQLAKPLQSFCIFYGAAHLPHMHKLALERGFEYKNTDYLTAWQVAAPPASPASGQK